MFLNLPNDMQKLIASYLDSSSLCFFAQTSKDILKKLRPQFVGCQRELHHLLAKSMVARGDVTWFYTSNVLYACGRNIWGQLGLGPTNIDREKTFKFVDKPPGAILKVVTSGYHTFVLTDLGLFGCGKNTYGQLGLGHKNNDETLLTEIKKPPGSIQQIAAGQEHTFVLTDQGLYACGNNRCGQLGLGHTNDSSTFVRVNNLSGTIQQVVASGYHTFVLTDHGLYACGNNRSGQLGLGHKDDCLAFKFVSHIPGIIQQIVVGDYHTFVITDQGLYACGGNRYGQLGLENNKDSHVSTLMPVSKPPGAIQQIVVGSDHAIVLTDQGLYAIGNNECGQLGLGHDKNCSNFTLVAAALPGVIQQVVSGEIHNLILTDQGLYGCGDNEYGQLGLGSIYECVTLTLIEKKPPELQRLQALYRQIGKLLNFIDSNEKNSSAVTALQTSNNFGVQSKAL